MENILADPAAAVKMGMEFLEKNKSYYALFVNSTRGDMLITRIIQYLEDRCSPVVDELFPDPDERARMKLFLIYTVGAFKHVITAWFGNQLHQSAENCANQLLEIYMASRPPELAALKKKNPENAE